MDTSEGQGFHFSRLSGALGLGVLLFTLQHHVSSVEGSAWAGCFSREHGLLGWTSNDGRFPVVLSEPEG